MEKGRDLKWPCAVGYPTNCNYAYKRVLKRRYLEKACVERFTIVGFLNDTAADNLIRTGARGHTHGTEASDPKAERAETKGM